MQYKGEDLDLRVPHVRASRDFYASDFESGIGNGRWSRAPSFGIGNGEPLWVDETLLACCNYAFDVAQANGAAEVDLEHLVNALTRVEAAARVLEGRGVREGYLRRESAALIASEVPAANAGDAVSPRRSADLEDVLRRASDVAHRRGSPAGVDDVLWALLHSSRDLPVVQLLRRLTPDWQRLEWGRIREQQMPEPGPRPVAVQLVANDGVHARMASVEDSLRLMQSDLAAERKLLMDLARDIQRDVLAQRGDGAAFRGDLGQRLEALERAVNARSEPRTQSLMVDRLAHLEQTMQSGLTEALRGTRELTQRLGAIENVITDVHAAPTSAAIGERIAALEKAVHNGLGEGARNWANLGQRLSKIEESLVERQGASDSSAIGERISSLERIVETSLAESARHYGQLGQRLVAFEGAIGGDGASRFVETLEPRLSTIEQRLTDTGSETQRRHGDVAARLETIGQILETGRSEAARLQGDMADRLSAIESYLAEGPVVASSSAGSLDVSELTERLGGLERAVRAGFGESASAMSQIAQRLVAVERHALDRPQDESMLILEDRLSALDSRGQQALSATSEIIQRLSAIEQRPIAETGTTIDTAAFVSPIEQKLATLETSSVTRVDEVQSAITTIAARLDQLDERMRADAVVTEDALRGRDQDFDFIYNEIKEISQSQATLNSAVSDWRTESQEHFSALANRLDKLHGPPPLRATPEVPAATTSPSTELPAAVKLKDPGGFVANGSVKKGAISEVSVQADDYDLPPEPGRGFWYWLFGTSSLSSANRENTLKITRMRDNIRETRERRRTEV